MCKDTAGGKGQTYEATIFVIQFIFNGNCSEPCLYHKDTFFNFSGIVRNPFKLSGGPYCSVKKSTSMSKHLGVFDDQFYSHAVYLLGCHLSGSVCQSGPTAVYSIDTHRRHRHALRDNQGSISVPPPSPCPDPQPTRPQPTL